MVWYIPDEPVVRTQRIVTCRHAIIEIENKTESQNSKSAKATYSFLENPTFMTRPHASTGSVVAISQERVFGRLMAVQISQLMP